MKGTLTIRLSTESRRELEEISRERGAKLSDVVRDALRRYLALRRLEKARDLVMPYARARGLLTDEDVFKLIS